MIINLQTILIEPRVIGDDWGYTFNQGRAVGFNDAIDEQQNLINKFLGK